MWKQLKRITKPNGAIVMTASQPFTTTLIASNMKMFRHQWVWDKKQAGNPFLAKIAPLKTFEDVLVFSQKKANYYPIMRKGVMRQKGGCKVESRVTASKPNGYTVANDDYYPTAIIEFSTAGMRGNSVHPTQKPVALMEYLIKTYTNEGDTVLDFTAGSMSTAVACINTNRKCIMIEKDEHYYNVGKDRVIKALQDKGMPLDYASFD
jgi:site-specific DNA-methyltransferase (adenine-specific)